MIETVVAYDGLPLGSGGAHGLGKVPARRALETWRLFLEGCADQVVLRSYFAFPQTPDLELDKRVRKLVEGSFPADPMIRERRAVRNDQIDAALELFESLEPLPTNAYGMAPLWLWVTADFKLRTPRGPGLWPDQDPTQFADFQTPGGIRLGSCSSRLILQAQRSMGLNLSIPSATDEDMLELGPWLQKSCPAKLSAKQWTRWTLTKNGKAYRGKKFTPGC